MAETKKHVYDESKIKTLSSLEHIRLRTGMYIGRIGDGSHYEDGCYILLKEVVDNAIDEFIMGYGKEVQIGIQDKAVSVRDFGRSEEHTSELQSLAYLVCRLLLEKKKLIVVACRAVRAAIYLA